MHPLKKKWYMLRISALLIPVLIVLRIIIDYYNLDVITILPVISALVTSVIFTIAVIFTGTLTDYKESEKIPGDLAASIQSLYYDSSMFPQVGPDLTNQWKRGIKKLYHAIVANFRSNFWDLGSIHEAMEEINANIIELANNNVAPPILVKLRNELTVIEKISKRIKQIKDTDFIPAAYAVAEISVAFVIFILLFTKSDSTIEMVVLISAITMVMTGLIFLIKDMDDPFEVNVGACADVDLFLIFELEEYLKE